jgi:hypothetical protein
LLCVGFFLSEIDVSLDVAGKSGKLFVGANLFFGALAVAEDGLSGFLIAPEIWVGGFGFEFF